MASVLRMVVEGWDNGSLSVMAMLQLLRQSIDSTPDSPFALTLILVLRLLLSQNPSLQHGIAESQHHLLSLVRLAGGFPDEAMLELKTYCSCTITDVIHASSSVSIGGGTCNTACFVLGRMYSLTSNHNEAVEWYRKAAQNGFALCQLSMGICYAKGDGVERDHTAAFWWYLQAAQQDLVEAQVPSPIYFIFSTPLKLSNSSVRRSM